MVAAAALNASLSLHVDWHPARDLEEAGASSCLTEVHSLLGAGLRAEAMAGLVEVMVDLARWDGQGSRLDRGQDLIESSDLRCD